MNIRSKFEKYVILKKNKIKISNKDIKKGDIFLALKGKNIHGSKFIQSSIKKGAKFCVTDNVKFANNKKVVFIENIIHYLISLAKIKRKLYNGKVIGITGSAGKTTLKETLAFFLNKNYTISYSQKSYNNELGVLISLLNLDLKSSYSIFEIGTNNFGEISHLTKIVKPSEIFITNIQSTHLENFRTKNNIAKEKSDIFKINYNNQKRKLYINPVNKSEKLIYSKAKKEKHLKIICVNDDLKNFFIKKIVKKSTCYEVTLKISKKVICLKFKFFTMFRLINLLFCYAFFSENALKTETITKYHKYLKPVEGRGLTHQVLFNNNKINIIDESYNANPDTMYQSCEYFNNLPKDNNKKILILGNMNELGEDSDKIHLKLLKHIDKLSFKTIILCGEFMQRSIKKLNNPRNEYFYLEDKNKIMNFLKKKVHNNDTILIKCSNDTAVNKFTKELLKKGNIV